MSKEYKNATFTFYNGHVLEQLDNVGFRIKGGITRNFFKKTFKISFNKFEKGIKRRRDWPPLPS